MMLSMTAGAIGIVLASLAISASAASLTAIETELAPTGTLRAGINYNNPLLARRDAATGELSGVAVDLSRELARRVGVPVELVPYEAAGKMGEDAKSGDWDIAYLAIDPARAETIDFTAAYAQLEKASGFVAEALKRHSLGPDDASVAPPSGRDTSRVAPPVKST